MMIGRTKWKTQRLAKGLKILPLPCSASQNKRRGQEADFYHTPSESPFPDAKATWIFENDWIIVNLIKQWCQSHMQINTAPGIWYVAIDVSNANVSISFSSLPLHSREICSPPNLISRLCQITCFLPRYNVRELWSRPRESYRYWPRSCVMVFFFFFKVIDFFI